MKAGDIVRFANPLTDDEQDERFIVLEVRGPRVLVEFVCDMHIRPTFAYMVAELVGA